MPIYGNQSTGTNSISTTRALLGDVWETTGGTIPSVFGRLNLNLTIQYAIYDVDGADSGQNPIAETAATAVDTSGADADVEIAFASPVTLPSGRYRFGFVGQGTGNIRYDTGGSADAVQGTGNNQNSFPDPFPDPPAIETTFIMCLWGEVTESAGGISIPVVQHHHRLMGQ